MLGYEKARETVIARVRSLEPKPAWDSVEISASLGRVLATDIVSDRDYPPFDRSIRDGYAVRAAETGEGATLQCVGELKAGDTPRTEVAAGACVQIMTGAALPPGADAVVMVEHTSREDDVVRLVRAVKPGQHVVRRGSEQRTGNVAVAAGTRLRFAEIASAAQVGAARVEVYRQPRIAILSTGDEVVDIAETPGPFQIRNSNSASLAAQVTLAGGEPVILGNAKDLVEDLRAKIVQGLQADVLILSGGVSMGKYDLVEPVLHEFGAEFVFDAVAIRPGKPVVFGICQGKPIFGLPGNPVSTMVTFELFVRPAIAILGGEEPRALPAFEAVLSETVTEKPGLAHFLPAVSSWPSDSQPGGPTVAPVKWQGSGDIVAMSRANCLLMVPAERERMEKGERVRVLALG